VQERKEPAGKPWDPANGSAPLIFAGGPTATSNPGGCAALPELLVLLVLRCTGLLLLLPTQLPRRQRLLCCHAGVW